MYHVVMYHQHISITPLTQSKSNKHNKSAIFEGQGLSTCQGVIAL